MNVSKVVIVNDQAGKKKYGTKGWAKVKKALGGLVKADAKREIATNIVNIDSQTEMKRFDGKAVTKAGSASQVKRAVDAIFKSSKPHYIMLLGGPDLIPHVPMRNPLYGLQDEEKTIPSDLPYACDTGHGLNVAKFVGVTRVVGRLPDVSGDSKPDYLVNVLKVASGWTSRSKTAYKKYFGVTAKVWRGSTRKNVRKLFGSTKPLRISPSDKPPWNKAKLKPRMHFINCHGAVSDDKFYGEPANHPIAHFSSNLKQAITEGTVVAAECCYGSELYNPFELGPNAELPICNRYLEESAYGYLGSSTIAYGAEDGILLADQVCQYFLKHVLEGASLGRAMLEARHEFARQSAPLDPYALKTLAQFNLLGDPSVHPVTKTGSAPKASTATTSSGAKPKSKTLKKKVRIKKSLWGELVDDLADSDVIRQLFQKTVKTTVGRVVAELDQRSDRRTKLFQKGIELGRKIAAVDIEKASKFNQKEVTSLLKGYAKTKMNAVVKNVTAFVVEEAEDWIHAKTDADKRRGDGAVRFLVGMMEMVQDPTEGMEEVVSDVDAELSKATANVGPRVFRKKMLVAKERNGKIESVNEYLTR